MNNQLIQKLIQSNNVLCPEFTYKNPLLDKNVARALAKSFVKILNISNQNSSVTNNLRLSILENIRKTCQVEPDNHIKVDDNFTELLAESYQYQLQDLVNNSRDTAFKDLEAFLVRKMKDINIDSTFLSPVNPEILQALINLNENGVYLDTLTNDIIHWNNKTNIYNSILKDFLKDCITSESERNSKLIDDISIKLKSEIEKTLLEICLKILTNNTEVDNIITRNDSLLNLIKSCAVSADSFQICSSVLNFLFIMTNFDQRILNFITTFVKLVKNYCPPEKFAVLYPIHISTIALILDFDIDKLTVEMKKQYIKLALKHLHQLYSNSETEFILLLSHFPQWFDIYFTKDHLVDD